MEPELKAALDQISGAVAAVERKLDALIAEIVIASQTPAPTTELTCAWCKRAGRRMSNCPACHGTGA